MQIGELFSFSFYALTCLSAFHYVYTHLANYRSWLKIPETKGAADIIGNHFFSILVPARNEVENIENCIQSLLGQNFPEEQFEVIFIDDHSTDDTVMKVKSQFGNRVKILELLETDFKGKKGALTAGISSAKGDWILTTDADCIVPVNWLRNLNSYLQKNDSIFVGGPVLFFPEKTVLGKFQELDMIGMMGVTAGGIHRKAAYLANGANLAYQKQAFNEVNGFSNIDKKASGDDILLLQKLAKKYRREIGFIKSKESIVRTPVEESWTSFFNQRIRWASKGNSFPNFQTWLQMVLVFLFCATIIFSMVLSIFNPMKFGYLFIVLALVKMIADYFYLSMLCDYFRESRLKKSIWWSSLIHAIYIVIIGIWSQFNRKYEWKGRKVN